MQKHGVAGSTDRRLVTATSAVGIPAQGLAPAHGVGAEAGRRGGFFRRLLGRNITWTVLLLLVSLFWGNQFVAIKYVLSFVNPLELITLRFLLAAILFAAVLLPAHGRRLWQVVRLEHWRLVLLALTGAIVNNVFLGWGMTRVAAGTGSLIVALNPAFTFVLSVLFLREKFVWRRVAGMIVAFAGLFVIVRWGSGREVSLDDIGYALLTMTGSFIWASFTVLGKSVLGRHPPILVVGLAMMLSGLISLVFVSPSFVAQLATFPALVWGAALFMAIPCTVFAFAVWFGALERMPAARVAAFIYLVPMWGVAFSHWLLDEPVTAALLLGAAILLTGVWLVNRR